MSIVENSWKVAVDGNHMERLFKKLKRVKQELKTFSFNVFGDLSIKVIGGNLRGFNKNFLILMLLLT